MPASSPNDTFRFLHFRAPALADDMPTLEAETPFAREIEALLNEHGAHHEALAAAAGRFTSTPEFLRRLEEAPLGEPLARTLEALAEEPPPTLEQTRAAIETGFGAPASDIVARDDYSAARHRIVESLLAIKFATGVFPQGGTLSRAATLLHVLDLLARDGEPSAADLARAFNGAFILDTVGPSKSPSAPPEDPPEGSVDGRVDPDRLRGAIREMEDIKKRKLYRPELAFELLETPDRPVRLPIPNAAPPTGFFSLFRPGGATREFLMGSLIETKVGGQQGDQDPAFTPTPEALEGLSSATRETLAIVLPEYEQLTVWNSINRLHGALGDRQIVRHQGGEPLVSIRFGEPSVNWGLLGKGRFMPKPGTWGGPSPVPTGSGRVRPAGIGDLMVVRQQIKRYEAEEVAHIENILRGTSKERHHRRIDITEESFSEEFESTEEREREFSTAERFELQQEASKTVAEDMSLQVGVTVSGSYGPVTFGTSAQFSYNRMQQETSRRASSYAKDVVDRSVERISERTSRRRERRYRREVEERNSQIFDNIGGADNIRGVYQWIVKVYEAQVFNYGRRLMFDFMTPEPAAFLRHALTKGKEKILPEPPIPLVETADDIVEESYAELAARYGATGIEPPPEPYVTVSETFDHVEDGDVRGKRFVKSAKLTIPEDYKATDAFMNFGISKGGEWWFDVFVGRHKYQFKWNVLRAWVSHRDLDDETESLPVGIHAGNVNAYTVVLEVLCEATERARQKWRLETFEKIQEAYRQRVRDYEDAMASLEARQSEVSNIGRNPAINRRTEHTELKKGCIALLTEQHFDLFDAMRGPSGLDLFGPNYPEMDFAEAEAEGAYIRFFENAFEWEQMTYLFYPYFWGRKVHWVERLLDRDVDPQFEAFLKAGSARVTVSVRPGFEEAVLHFLDTGKIWNGADGPPDIGSPLYVSLVTEIRERTGGLEDAEPVGSPWDVRIPTDLLALRSDDALPEWEKGEDGVWRPKEGSETEPS